MKLWKVSFRYIEKQRLLSCFTIIAIILSVTMIYLYGIVQKGVNGLQENQIEKTMGSYHVRFSDLDDEQSEDLRLDDRIEQCGEVADIGIGEKGGQKFVFVGLDQTSFSLTGMNLLFGDLPKDENEIMLEERMLDRLGISNSVPQNIEITVTDFDGNNSQSKEYQLIGILENHVTGELAPRGWGYAGKGNDNQHDLLIRLEENDNIYEAIANLEGDYGIENDQISYNESLLSVIGEQDDVIENNGMTYIMVIILVSASILIISMYGVSVNMRKKQFAVLKYAGATNRQIHFILLSEALILSGIGCILGCVIAIISKNAFVGIIGRTINPEALYMNTSFEVINLLNDYTNVSLGLLLFASLVGMGITCFSVWMIIIKNAKQENAKKIQRKNKRNKKMKNVVSFIARNNLYRNKWRTYFTIATMSIAFIAFLCVSLYAKTIRPNEAILNMMDSDFALSTEMSYIMPNDLLEYISTGEIEQIAGMDGIERVKVRYSVVTIPENEEQAFYLVSYDNKTMSGLVKECGLDSLQMSNEQICIGRNGSDGDVYSGTLNINETIYVNGMEFQIAAVTKTKDILGKEMLEPDIIVDYSWYQQITGRSDANRIDVYMKDDATEDEIEQVKLTMKQLQEKHPVMNYSDYIEIKAQLEESAKSTKEMAYTIVAVLSMIGLMGIANTLLTSIYRRTAEIATFRVGGMTQYQVICMVLYESMQYGIKTLIYGIPIGSVIAIWFSYNAIQEVLFWDLIKQVILASSVLIGLCIIFSIPAVLQITSKDMLSYIKEE